MVWNISFRDTLYSTLFVMRYIKIVSEVCSKHIFRTHPLYHFICYASHINSLRVVSRIYILDTPFIPHYGYASQRNSLRGVFRRYHLDTHFYTMWNNEKSTVTIIKNIYNFVNIFVHKYNYLLNIHFFGRGEEDDSLLTRTSLLAGILDCERG